MADFKKEAIAAYREKLKRIGYDDYQAEVGVAGLMTGFKIVPANVGSEEDQRLALELIKL